MNMFALIVVFLFPAAISSQGSSSNLDQLIDDLSVLSRVTTAIAIRNMALQKTLNVPTVVADLLKVDEAVFTNLITLDTAEMTVKVGTLLQKLEKLDQPTLNDVDLDDVSSAEEFLSRTALEDIQSLRSSSHFSAAKLVDLLNKKKEVQLPCEKLTTEDFPKLADVMKSTTADLKDRIYLSKQIRQSAQIRQCLKRISSFQESSFGELYFELVEMKKVFSLREMAIDFNMNLARDSVFESILGKVANDLRRAENVSDGGKVGTRLLEASQLTKRLKSSLGSPSTLTAGFSKGLEDIVKVQSDLKSEWFREKVSRGKSIEPLESALESFLKSAEQSEKLGAAWKELMSIDDKKVEKVATMVTSVENIKVVLNSVENMTKTFESCWKSSSAEQVEEPELEGFKTNYRKVPWISDRIQSVWKKVSFIAESLKNKDIESIFDKFVGLYVEDLAISEVKRVREDALKIPNIGQLIEASELFNGFRDDVHMLISSLKNFKFPPNFDIKIVDIKKNIEESKMLDLFECLNRTSFKPSVLSDARNSLWAAMQFQKDQSYLGPVKGFVDKVVGVQTVVKTVEQSTEKLGGVRGRRSTPSALLSKVNDAHGLSMHLGDGIRVLRGMAKARNEKQVLLNATRFPDDVLDTVRRKTKVDKAGIFWTNPEVKIQRVLDALDALEVYAETAGNKELRLLAGVFKEAQKVPGIGSFRELFTELSQMFPNSSDPKVDVVIQNANILKEYDLDFVKHQKSLDAAYISIDEIAFFYDEIFGFMEHATANIVVDHKSSLLVVVAIVGSFIIVIVVGLVIYGFTKRGRSQIRETWLRFFPDQKTFEKRCLYARCMDREHGEQGLLIAVEMKNPAATLKLLKGGTYVDIYSKTGNTPLHMATANCCSKNVEHLIKFGADRTLLNTQNRTPEQCIPTQPAPDDVKECEKIRKIYKRLSGKKYRKRMLPIYPVHMYQVGFDSNVDQTLRDEFLKKFGWITDANGLLVTTQCVAKVGTDGVLETNDYQLLSTMFQGSLMIREQWMRDCLADERNLRKDSDYLIEDVRFKGVLYESAALKWMKAQAKSEMRFLIGAQVFLLISADLVDLFSNLVAALGAENNFENDPRKRFILTAHPYLHSNIGPAIIIYDKTRDVENERNDPMYTLFEVDEFIVFLLNRESHPVQGIDPPATSFMAEEEEEQPQPHAAQ